MAKQESLLDVMTPGQTFGLGVIATILVGCTIGFFVLLTGGTGEAEPTPNGGQNPGTVNNPPTQPSEPPQPSQVSINPVNAETDHIRGDVDAPVTLVEYSDFECPFCDRFAPTLKQALDEFDGQVRLVYRHFPLRSIHNEAAPAAEASECAAEQGVFWEFHDAMFANQDKLGESFYVETAGNLGVNVDEFESCLESDRNLAAVQEDEQDARAAGGQGTPHTIIMGPDGQQIPLSGAQPYSALKAAIEQVL